LTPFDALLCERSAVHARQWAQGFSTAEQWASQYPEKVAAIYAAVSVAGDWTTTGLPYDAWHEGLVHGIYGLKEYEYWKAA
jgi:hypothetical protein